MEQTLQRVSRSAVLARTNRYKAEYKAGKITVSSLESGKAVCSRRLYSGLRAFLAKLRPFERLLRLGPRLCTALSETEFLLSCGGKLYRIDCEAGAFEVDTVYPEGTNNPLYLCRAADGTVLYGEYSWNTDRGEVGIHIREDGVWRELARFPAHTVCHIHNVLDDPGRGCFWVMTGDEDEESGIWRLDKNGVLTPVSVGSQTARACFGFLEGEYLYYATDTPLQANALYRLQPETGITEKLCDMPGPCIYGKTLKINGLPYHFFATSVEPDSSLHGWRYRLTNRLGAGVRERYSHILVRTPEGGVSDIFRAKKDAMPMWLFQFGNIQFPDCAAVNGKLLLNPTALHKADGGTYCLSINLKEW